MTSFQHACFYVNSTQTQRVVASAFPSKRTLAGHFFKIFIHLTYTLIHTKTFNINIVHKCYRSVLALCFSCFSPPFLSVLSPCPSMFRVDISSLVINLKNKKIRKNTCREIISIQTQNSNSDPKATLSCDHRYYIRNGFSLFSFPTVPSCWPLKSPTPIFLSDVCRARSNLSYPVHGISFILVM